MRTFIRPKSSKICKYENDGVIRTQLWSCNPPLTRESTVPCHICIWTWQFCHEDSTTFSALKFTNANLRPRETLVPSHRRTHLLVIRYSSVLSSPLWPLGWNLSVTTEAVQSRRVPFQYGHLRPTNITITAVYCNSSSRTFFTDLHSSVSLFTDPLFSLEIDQRV